MSTVTTELTGLHVETVGSGTPLLIAHGGPGLDHRLYHSLAPLADERQLVFWDHRGHGGSGPLPEGPVEMSLFADDAIRVADALGLETFALFGHSFGGWVAQEAALRYPDRVSALLLAGTTPGQLGATESAADDQGPPPDPELLELLTHLPASDAAAAVIYRQLLPYYLHDPARVASLPELGPEDVSASAMAAVFDAQRRWSSVDRLHRIGCRTLLVAGRYDRFCSVEQHHRIARRLFGAELHTYEQSGHFPWLEEPTTFFTRTNAWLSGRTR